MQLNLKTLALLIVCLFVGCADHDKEFGDAKVNVAISGLTAADVTSVSVTVTAADIASPITGNLTKVGAGWQGTIPNIPAGVNRTFTSNAYDVSSTLLFTGAATTVTITAGNTAVVMIILQEATPPGPFENSAPYITSFWLSSDQVEPSTNVILGAQAYDPDGDPLTYAWSSTAGSFSAPTSTDTNWLAPSTDGAYPITFTVTDPHNASDSLTATINVNALTTGAATVGIDINMTPRIANVTSSLARLQDGATTTLSVSASDPDGDQLSYSWTSNCSGTFGDVFPTQSTSLQFSLQDASASACAFTVTVNDGHGAMNAGTIHVIVAAPPATIPGLIAWWTGDSTLTDEVTGRTLTPSNGYAFDTGVHGGAIRFTSTDQSLRASSLGFPDGAADRTMELWVRLDAQSVGENIFANYGGYGMYTRDFGLASSGNTPFFSNWGWSIAGGTISADSTWHHVAVTVESGVQNLYLDGTLVASGSLTLDTVTGPGYEFVLGALDPNRTFVGAVDDVRIYDRALSGTQISRIAAGNTF